MKKYTLTKLRSPTAILFFAWIAITWVQPWAIELKMDAMTYAALAKNILTTGDWLTLHYGHQAYQDFFQHPPLVIWIQALFFKLLGVSDLSARVLPGLFALGSIYLVVRMGGFLAGLVLILTPKFIKYGADFYLDGPLGFWMALYAFCALRNAPLGMAFALAAAFMTKGLVAGVLPVATLALVVWDRKKLPLLWKSTLGAILLVSPWLFFGNGLNYLEQYWQQSVSGRTRAEHPFAHVQPLLHLLLVYFPWWIALGFGYSRAVKTRRKDLAFLGLCALGILAGFSIVGHFYEHYFLPFYVLAAPLAGFGLYEALRPSPQLEAKIVVGTGLAAVLVLFVNILPVSIHQNRNADLLAALEHAKAHCRSVQNVHVATDPSGFAWPEMAVIQWKTNWQTVFDRTHRLPDSDADPAGILITPLNPNARWKSIAAFRSLTLYAPKAGELCSSPKPN